MRLYDPSEGTIMIDGQDIRSVSLSSLRSQIALVPQSPAIFSGTIKENILLANPDASDKEIKEVFIISDAIGLVNKFEKGLDTTIGQAGVHLSGGEIQKIAIARALLKKPKILLLDEPTSAIDAESSKRIMNTIKGLRKYMSIILIDHKINSVDLADNVITIHNGVVVDNINKTIVKELYNGVYLAYSLDNSNYALLNNGNVNIMRDAISYMKKGNKEMMTNTIETKTIETNTIQDKFVEYKVIGRSPQNRRLDVVFIGDIKNPKLKVCVLAGQHGDEKIGRQSAVRLIEHLIKSKEFPDICVGVLSNANPDGAFKNRRRNAAKIDLNRDHLLLMSEENRIIHSFIQSWKPDVLI